MWAGGAAWLPGWGEAQQRGFRGEPWLVIESESEADAIRVVGGEKIPIVFT